MCQPASFPTNTYWDGGLRFERTTQVAVLWVEPLILKTKLFDVSEEE